MSDRIGNPVETITAATKLGAAAGVAIPLNNSGWAVLISVFAKFVATATGGNRIVMLQLLDKAGNIIWQISQGTAITSGQTALLGYGGGVAAQAFTAPILQVAPLPAECSIPPMATMQFLDGNNVDVNDTVAPNVVYSL